MQHLQPRLGRKWTLLFLVIISAFPPLTTDLYLPALPHMVETLHTSQTLINLTLSGYFGVYAAGLLFWGPLSEKFGRKPIMLVGIGLYILASLACAASYSVEMLIGSRVFQAFGGSAVTVVATAIVKDMYQGREREKIMATIMSLVIIAPMIAPVLGAFLLTVGDWHWMFIALAIFGAVCLPFALAYRETLPEKYTGSVFRAWGRLWVVTQNGAFVHLLLIFSLPALAMMAFLAAGSYIYINGFGLEEQVFSFFFAFNAFCASFAPRVYLKVTRYISIPTMISLCFLGLTLSGLAMMMFGASSPYLFALLAATATMSVIALRVPGTNLMLEQQSRDTGSAVAVIQFSTMMCGALGMSIVSLNPDTMLQNLAWIQLAIGLVGSVLWWRVKGRPFVVEKLPQVEPR